MTKTEYINTDQHETDVITLNHETKQFAHERTARAEDMNLPRLERYFIGGPVLFNGAAYSSRYGRNVID